MSVRPYQAESQVELSFFESEPFFRIQETPNILVVYNRGDIFIALKCSKNI